jgi:hypothetical protein
MKEYVAVYIKKKSDSPTILMGSILASSLFDAAEKAYQKLKDKTKYVHIGTLSSEDRPVSFWFGNGRPEEISPEDLAKKMGWVLDLKDLISDWKKSKEKTI